MPKSNTSISWTRKFEYFVIGCASKNGHNKDTSLKEIDLRAWNMLSILVFY